MKTRFGYDEVIHPFDTAKVFGEKTIFSFGTPTSRMAKQSESIRVDDTEHAIAEFITAIKKLKVKEQRYLCFEVFTDESEHKVFRVNACHIKDLDIVDSI